MAFADQFICVWKELGGMRVGGMIQCAVLPDLCVICFRIDVTHMTESPMPVSGKQKKGCSFFGFLFFPFFSPFFPFLFLHVVTRPVLFALSTNNITRMSNGIV